MLEAIKDFIVDTKETLQEVFKPTGKANLMVLDEHRYPSFSSLLPYKYYDEENHIFFNKHNAGVLYKVIPLTGANEQLAEQLDMILRTKVSHDFVMQVILVKHNKVGHEIDAFASQFNQKDFKNLDSMGERLGEFYKQAARAGFKTNSLVKSRLTHSECFIVIDKANRQSEDDLKACFAQFCIPFEAALMAAKIGFKRANADDLLYLLHFYHNCDNDMVYPDHPAYDKSQMLNRQVLSHDFDLNLESGGLVVNNVNLEGTEYSTAISVLTVDRLPDSFRLWEGINSSANIFFPEQNISCNHIIAVTYVVDEQSSAQGRANRKTRDLDKKAHSDYALRVAGTEEQAHAWRAFRDDLASQKTRSVKMLYNLVLFSKIDAQARDIEIAKSAFNYNGIKLALCKRMQLPYLLASMPFLFTNNLAKDFILPTMMWPISSWNATQYLPICADWAGVGKGVLLPTMRDQFACIDPFSGVFGTNFNIAVTGTSGSGKSFFIQMLMLNVIFNNGDIFIIDIGGSYRKLCEALGGTYLEYKNLAMNPFTHVQDIMLELDDIIALFELLTCPTQGASDDDRGTLREAILIAFSERSTLTCIDDVQRVLLDLYAKDRDTYPSARILSKNLQRYSSQAEHGRAFNCASELSPHARIIVVDLKDIEDNQSIRAPVLLSVISQFQRRMFNSDRNRQKMCIIDEAWSFFTGDAIAANFITKGFRTGRRHKASFVTITQGIDDYYQFAEARAAWENSALKLIFLQEQAALLEHQKQHDTFSDFEIKLLEAFPKAKDAGFSQVLLRANGISSFHRLFVDPFTKVVLSSDGSDYQAVSDYLAQGLDFNSAVAKVASAHYGY